MSSDPSNAVALVEVDADVKRQACLVCGLTHSLPFYTIGFMRFRSSERPQSEAEKGFHVIFHDLQGFLSLFKDDLLDCQANYTVIRIRGFSRIRQFKL